MNVPIGPDKPDRNGLVHLSLVRSASQEVLRVPLPELGDLLVGLNGNVYHDVAQNGVINFFHLRNVNILNGIVILIQARCGLRSAEFSKPLSPNIENSKVGSTM